MCDKSAIRRLETSHIAHLPLPTTPSRRLVEAELLHPPSGELRLGGELVDGVAVQLEAHLAAEGLEAESAEEGGAQRAHVLLRPAEARVAAPAQERAVILLSAL